MTTTEAKELLNAIKAYVLLQDYKEAPKFFNLLQKYKADYPDSCYYSGIAYRKNNKYNIEFGTYKSCSKIKGANRNISFLHTDLRYYQFECKKAFDLENIIKYLINTYNITCVAIDSLLARVINEGEIIALLTHNSFRKEQQVK